MKEPIDRGLVGQPLGMTLLRLADGSVLRVAAVRSGYVVVLERVRGERDWVLGLTPGEAKQLAGELSAAAEAINAARRGKKGSR